MSRREHANQKSIYIFDFDTFLLNYWNTILRHMYLDELQLMSYVESFLYSDGSPGKYKQVCNS